MEKTKNQEIEKKTKKKPTSRALFFGGIPKSASPEDIEEYFSKFGKLSFFKLEKDRYKKKEEVNQNDSEECENGQGGTHRGCGFIRYEKEETNALLLKTKHIFMGKAIDIKEAKSKKERRQYETTIRKERRKIYIGDLSDEYNKGNSSCFF